MGEETTSSGGTALRVSYSHGPRRPGALAYRLDVKVEEASGIPAEIFVFHRDTRMLATGLPFDWKSGAEFQNVATPVDIEETCPEDEVSDATRFFRSSSVTLLFRSGIDMEQAREAISEDIASLVKSWDEVSSEGDSEVVWYRGPSGAAVSAVEELRRWIAEHPMATVLDIRDTVDRIADAIGSRRPAPSSAFEMASGVSDIAGKVIGNG